MADLIAKEISLARRNADAATPTASRAQRVDDGGVDRSHRRLRADRPDVAMPAHPPPRTLFRADHIGPHHALASAAIPLLFPPVRIDDELYLDGGLRQNTPIAPALRLGATHIFAIGGSREVRGMQSHEDGAPKLARSGSRVLARKDTERVSARPHRHRPPAPPSHERRHPGRHARLRGRLPRLDQRAGAAAGRAAPTNTCIVLPIRPSEDIGRMASVHVRKGRFKGDPFVTKRLFSLLDMASARRRTSHRI